MTKPLIKRVRSLVKKYFREVKKPVVSVACFVLLFFAINFLINRPKLSHNAKVIKTKCDREIIISYFCKLYLDVEQTRAYGERKQSCL